MSQVYSTEPTTSGRVTLETTAGPIDIQLWCKECPSTTRFFLQLCMDGFYNNMVFHRIMDNFLIQTGGFRKGEKIDDQVHLRKEQMSKLKEYYKKIGPAVAIEEENEEDNKNRKRKLELNGRIRFNHRGQLAMAIPLDADIEGDEAVPLAGQFFITLDEAPFLDQKHIIFGTVTGPTMFNAIRIGRTEVTEEDNRPVDLDISPPTVISTKVHSHNFTESLVATPEHLLPWKMQSNKRKDSSVDPIKARKKKRKGKKDLNVLSFGNDMEESFTDVDPNIPSVGMQSSHDVLSNETSFLQKEADTKIKLLSTEKTNKTDHRRQPDKEPSTDESVNEIKQNYQVIDKDSSNSPLVHSENGRADICLKNKYISQKNKEKKEEMKKVVPSESTNHQEPKLSVPTSKQTMSYLENRRANYMKKSQQRSRMKKNKREEDILSKLKSFRKKVQNIGRNGLTNENNDSLIGQDNAIATRMATRFDKDNKHKEQEEQKQLAKVSYHGQVLEENNDNVDSNDTSWYRTDFKCKRHVDHSSRDISGGDGRNVDDYVVVDLRKGKHKRSNNHVATKKM